MTFLSLGLVLTVALLHAAPPIRPLGDLWFGVLVASYWLLSLPVVAHALIGRLQGRYGTIRTAAEAHGAKIIVAVGNGSVSYTDGHFTTDQLTRRSTFCVFEATRLYRLLQPDDVIVSGGAPTLGSAARAEADLMREELVKLGVPAERIRADTASRTTEEQAVNVARLLRQARSSRQRRCRHHRRAHAAGDEIVRGARHRRDSVGDAGPALRRGPDGVGALVAEHGGAARQRVGHVRVSGARLSDAWQDRIRPSARN